jgi:hypothetical protein
MIEEVVGRIERQSGSAATRAAPLAVPSLRGLPVDDESHGVSGFAGMIGFDQATAGSNVFDFEPPDQALCVGNGFVVEGVNLALAIYSPQGQLLAGPASLNDFFGLADELTDPRNLSDPRCLYDPGSNRWFVVLTQFELDDLGNITGSQLRIAVSHGGDPTGGYQLYSLETSNDGSDFFPGDCPCLGDQPLIGADANGFYLSTNSFGQISYQGAQLYLLSKADLAANSAVVHGFHVGT